MIMSLCYRAELPKSLSRAAGVRELGARGCRGLERIVQGKGL